MYIKPAHHAPLQDDFLLVYEGQSEYVHILTI